MALEPVTIADVASGSRARILPGFGFNCFEFSVNTPAGALETLWSERNFTSGKCKPTRSGIPLLFPFAGRLRGTSFQFEGKSYELKAGDGQGNAIHGFVFDRPWRVTDQAADRVVGEFQASVDDPSILAHWPADFRISTEYRILGNALTAAFHVENPSDKPLPFGLGAHPYFRVPLGGDSADDCVATVPVSDRWELAALLPTGRQTPDADSQHLARGMRVGKMQLDAVFGGLTYEHGRATSSIRDPGSGRTLVLSFGDVFTTCVVFNPPHREAVCIEPYTTVPDAFYLAEQGVETHLQLLPPGGSFRADLEIRVD